AALGKARAAAHRAHVPALDHDLDRVDALGIVAARGGAYDAEEIVVPGVHAQHRVRRYDEGAQVQRGAELVRDPVRVHLDDLLQALKIDVLGDVRDAHTRRGVIHARNVLRRAEQLDDAVG